MLFDLEEEGGSDRRGTDEAEHGESKSHRPTHDGDDAEGEGRFSGYNVLQNER